MPARSNGWRASSGRASRRGAAHAACADPRGRGAPASALRSSSLGGAHDRRRRAASRSMRRPSAVAGRIRQRADAARSSRQRRRTAAARPTCRRNRGWSRRRSSRRRRSTCRSCERAEPREPLSQLSLALPPPPKPKSPNKWSGTPFFRPVATGSAVFESMGHTIAIAGVESLSRRRDLHVATASPGPAASVRAPPSALWLRGRAAGLQGAAGGASRVAIVAPCRLGKQDVGAWLVANGWARAAPGGPYVEAEREGRGSPARASSAPPPDTSGLSIGAGAAPRRSSPTRRSSPSRLRRRQLAGQRLVDQRPRLGDAVERGERAEARAALLADQHLVDHLEEGARNARAALRALLE